MSAKARRPAKKANPAKKPAAKKAAKPAKKKAKPAAKKAKPAARKAKPAKLKAKPEAKKAPAEAKKAPVPAAEAKNAPAAEAKAPKVKKRARVTAEKLGELQREISISEFFTKNRHLLGFDNASRALMTSVKEAVDNGLDACEEAGILPELKIRLKQLGENRFWMSVEDNGPGIVKAQIPKIFGKLLYGSKFHRLRQSRGQQGIGISAAAMYGQLTTGKPCIVTSKTAANKPAHHYHITIDTTQNRPIITHDAQFEWAHKERGTNVEIEMEAIYKGGKRSVDEYIQQVAVANPHARIEYLAPGKQPLVYPRLTNEMPREAKEIKPHPHGVELGILQRMSQGTKSRTLSGFLQKEFSRVSGPVAEEICKNANVDHNISVKELNQGLIEQVYQAIAKTKIMSPPTNCLAPIGEPALLDGLKALLVQRHIAEEIAKEAKTRKRAEPNAAAPAQDKKAIEANENMVTKEIEQITAMVADEDVDDDGERIDDGNGNGSNGDSEEALTRTGIINVYGKPCFITAVSRHAKVYRGNPFLVEAALAYGGEMSGDDLATVVRLANRVPLLYQQGACAMSQAVTRTNWRSYDIDQSRGALPSGPLLILVHIASVWVPFTSEAKEAVAHYDEIIGELKFALQECGRRVSRHIRRRRRVADAEKKAKYIERYIPHIGVALQDILGLPNSRRDKVVKELTGILERSRKM